MKKDPKILLFDVLDSIESIEKYTKKVSQEKFFDRPQVQDAVVRRIEVMGEAVKNLPTAFRNKHGSIPWKKIAGTRDVLIHDYSEIDISLVWEIVKKEIPVLKKQISKLIEEI